MGYEGAAGAIRTLVPAPSRRGKGSTGGNRGGVDGRGWLGAELKGLVASAVQCSGWPAEISSHAMLFRSVIQEDSAGGWGLRRRGPAVPWNASDEEKWGLCWHKRSGGLVHSADIGLTEVLFFCVSPNIHVLVYLDPECM